MCRVPAALFVLILFLTSGCVAKESHTLSDRAISDLMTRPYLLGIGDRIRITIYNETTLTGEYLVRGDGNISFPLLENIRAAGVQVPDLQTEIKERLADGYVLDPKVSIEVINYRPFYIMGEVARPGEYPFSMGLTLQNAVAVAGGYTYRANTRRVFLKRVEDPKEILINISDGRPLPIMPGDTVRIGERFF